MTVDERPECRKCRFYCSMCGGYYHCCNYCAETNYSRGCSIEDCELWKLFPRDKVDILKGENV